MSIPHNRTERLELQVEMLALRVKHLEELLEGVELFKGVMSSKPPVDPGQDESL